MNASPESIAVGLAIGLVIAAVLYKGAKEVALSRVHAGVVDLPNRLTTDQAAIGTVLRIPGATNILADVIVEKLREGLP